MVDKYSSSEVEVSDYSETEKILDVLSEKLPFLEATLTSSLTVLKEIAEEENQMFDDRIDFIQAFKYIIDIYDLNKLLVDSYYRKKTLVHKIKNFNFKYLDLKTSFKNLIVEHKQKEINCKQLEDVLRDVENENFELKIKIEDLQEVIKSLKESQSIKMKILEKSLPPRRKESLEIHYEEQVKHLQIEINELSIKCCNLNDTVINKDKHINLLEKSQHNYTVRLAEFQDEINKLKNENQYKAKKLILTRNELEEIKAEKSVLETKLNDKEKSVEDNSSNNNKNLDRLNNSKLSNESECNRNKAYTNPNENNTICSIDLINFKTPLDLPLRSARLKSNDFECNTPTELISKKKELKESIEKSVAGFCMYSPRNDEINNKLEILAKQRIRNSHEFREDDRSSRGKILNNMINNIQINDQLNTLENILSSEETNDLKISNKEKATEEIIPIYEKRRSDMTVKKYDFNESFRENFNRVFVTKHKTLMNITDSLNLSDRIFSDRESFFEKRENKTFILKFLIESLKKKKEYKKKIDKVFPDKISSLLRKKNHNEYLSTLEEYLDNISVCQDKGKRSFENRKVLTLRRLKRKLYCLTQKIKNQKKFIKKLKKKEKESNIPLLRKYKKYKYEMNEIEEEIENKTIDFNCLAINALGKIQDLSDLMSTLSNSNIIRESINSEFNNKINLINNNTCPTVGKFNFLDRKSTRSNQFVKENIIQFKIKKSYKRNCFQTDHLKQLEITFTILKKIRINHKQYIKESTDFTICSPSKVSSENLQSYNEILLFTKETNVPISYQTCSNIFSQSKPDNQIQKHISNKDQLKLFYRRYLKHTDFFLSDSFRECSKRINQENNIIYGSNFSKFKLFFTRNNITINKSKFSK